MKILGLADLAGTEWLLLLPHVEGFTVRSASIPANVLAKLPCLLAPDGLLFCTNHNFVHGKHFLPLTGKHADTLTSAQTPWWEQ